jgi:replicative DNA helicase
MYTNGATKAAATAVPTNQTILMPHSHEAEEALIGAALIDNDIVLEVRVSPDDFYSGKHKDIWKAITELVAAGHAADFLTVAEVLTKRGVKDANLYGYITATPYSIHAHSYAAAIRANAQRRALFRAASTLTTEAINGAKPVEAIITDAEQQLMAIRGDKSVARLTDSKTAVSRFIDSLEAGPPDVIPTGLVDFDRLLLGGMERQNVYIFAAAEKMGKTALMSGTSRHNALAGRVVVRFSLEMSTQLRLRRDCVALSGVPLAKVKQRTYSQQEKARLMDALGRISETKMETDDTPGITPSQMRAVLNRVAMKYGHIDLIEIDYFQKGQPDKRTGNRVEELEEFSDQVRSIAKEYNAVVIMAAQVLSKSIEQRGDKRPYLSDVFGSSALAKDAQLIAFLYRDEYYNPLGTDKINLGELIIRAHRDGPTGEIDLFFDGERLAYKNYANQSISPA